MQNERMLFKRGGAIHYFGSVLEAQGTKVLGVGPQNVEYGLQETLCLFSEAPRSTLGGARSMFGVVLCGFVAVSRVALMWYAFSTDLS